MAKIMRKNQFDELLEIEMLVPTLQPIIAKMPEPVYEPEFNLLKLN
jgi:hypothetical protein